MLGIGGASPIDAESAAKLNLPVEEGLQLDNVIDGLSAQMAGAQIGDVVISIGETQVKDFQTLTTALGAHKAGDTVELKFYRDSELHTVDMTLAGRPKTDVPSKAADLAQQLKKAYAEGAAELAALFEGVSDEAASHQPTPDDYSAKDVMAHLIATQVDLNAWIASLVQGQELNTFTGGTRLKSIVATYPTAPELLDALKRAEAQAVALLAELPEEFVARKGSYVRMGTGLIQNYTYHNSNHMNQVRTTLESAQEPVAA